MSKFTIMYLYVFACVNIRAVDFIGLYKRNNEKSQNCVTIDQIIIVRSVVNGMASGLFQELIFFQHKVFFQQIKDYVWRTNHTKYCSINYEIHVINFKNFLQKKV